MAQVVEYWPRNLMVVGVSPVQDSSSVSLSVEHHLLDVWPFSGVHMHDRTCS